MAETHEQTEGITSVLHEGRVFPPPPEFVKKAHVQGMEGYQRLAQEAHDDPEAYWGKAASLIHWFQKWDRVLDWDNPPFAKWYVGGKTNISYNCLDRHLETRGDKPAIIWEGEPGEQRTFTYRELYAEVCKFANVLKGLGINQGDRVGIYMPMIPETAIAMLACTRIGAVHSVIFGGFAAEAVRDRMTDAEAKLIITTDGGYRRGAEVLLKPTVDEAVERVATIEHVVVYRRTGSDIRMRAGRDLWWHDLMQDASSECAAVELDAEAPLLILDTSGTTG
ncbi:MAG: AMP-binding protein, partial [Dehalococcoidia bacterium]